MTKLLRGLASGVLCVVVVLHARPAAAQTADDAALRADIQKFMELTGAARLASQMASFMAAQVLDSLKRTQPQFPDRAVTLIREVLDQEFAKAFSSGERSMLPDLVEVYAKHFTRDDIRELVAFYESPIGRKLLRELPAVQQDAALAGQRWMQAELPRLTELLQSRLRAEGLIK